jgi:geranylgeranyl pyrophosphate synthase
VFGCIERLAVANVEKEGREMTQFDYYMRKTYLKTASLLEKCCSCAAILGEADRATIDIAKAYGTHLGYAFQVRILLPSFFLI